MYRLVRENQSRKALTVVYDYMDRLVLDGRFPQAATVLQIVDLTQLDSTCIVGFLTVTFSAREHIPTWAPLQVRARQACLDRGMPADKVERVFGDMK
ncbi:MAG: hypothetical protein HY898_10630 [Deltaproteobacteria bacterium]|nr:hypothetical protein [Deltaproteobacteria bacterium]